MWKKYLFNQSFCLKNFYYSKSSFDVLRKRKEKNRVAHESYSSRLPASDVIARNLSTFKRIRKTFFKKSTKTFQPTTWGRFDDVICSRLFTYDDVRDGRSRGCVSNSAKRGFLFNRERLQRKLLGNEAGTGTKQWNVRSNSWLMCDAWKVLSDES